MAVTLTLISCWPYHWRRWRLGVAGLLGTKFFGNVVGRKDSHRGDHPGRAGCIHHFGDDAE
jgi:hypothetical protein